MKIFVITLPAATMRQESIKSQLNALNLTFEFFPGADGRKLGNDEILKYYDTKKANKYLGRDLTRGEIGCALSHKHIYEKMIADNIQRTIVLEDDIIIDDKFPDLVCLLDKFRISSYIVKLDSVDKQTVPWHKIRLSAEYSIEHPLSSVTYTWGYYIDILAAKTMLKILDKIFLEADRWEIFKSFIKLRILNKQMIANNNIFDSEIGERGEIRANYVSKINIINKVIKLVKLLRTLFH
jgi:GR25 family glycosyltransferase involved in LPS biosynthesis